MSDEGRMVADRYRVIKRIGTGAMGAIWQAEDLVLHRTVAIKQLLLPVELDDHAVEEARQRTMREGRIAARIHHPNAISVFDVASDDNGQPCLIMEYLDSTSLAYILQQHTTLDPTEVARIGAQIAGALHTAHEVGIVHRDVKPGNILLTDDGLAKLTDFGISRANDDVTVTKTGLIAGTPAYLAPEVAVGGDPGPESDVFALGSTLYAATEGQPPFGLSENTLSLLHTVAAGQINPPRQSGALTSVLAIMLHPEIERRPSAEECVELLSAVARDGAPIDEDPHEHPQGHSSDSGDTTTVLGPLAAAAAAGAAEAAPPVSQDDSLPNAHFGTLEGPDESDYAPTSSHGPAPAAEDHGTVKYAAGDHTEHYADAGYADEYPPSTDHYGDYYGDEEHDTPYPADTLYAWNAQGSDNGFGGEAQYTDDEYGDLGNGDDRSRSWTSWAIPATIGSLVVTGMAVFTVWLFGGSSGGDAEQDPAPQHGIVSTSSTPSSTSSSTTSSSTTTTTTQETSEPVSEMPADPGKTTTTTTTTTSSTTTTTTTSSTTSPSPTTSSTTSSESD